MRVVYDAHINTTLALGDQPEIKTDRPVKTSYIESIFKHLLVMDSLPDNNYPEVVHEASLTIGMADPAFQILIGSDFEKFIHANEHALKWGKIQKDYAQYIKRESARRNKQNPYYIDVVESEREWDSIPDYTRQKPHQPWQFDHIYRDSQYLAGQVYELTKDYKKHQDKDLFRAKVNSLLSAAQVMFGLNINESVNDFAEIEISIVNIKLSLDAYKLCYLFLSRTVESLHKMRWSDQYPREVIDDTIHFADDLVSKLKGRILETERRFMLYVQSGLEQEW